MASPFEQVLLNSHKPEIIRFLQQHPEYFQEAIQLAIGEKEKVSWRAAWMLWAFLEENDARIKPYLNRIIKNIPKRSESQQRELLKIIYLMDLNEQQESALFELCLSIWKEVKMVPSLRYNALKCLMKMMKKHPELENEIRFVTTDIYTENLSHGFKHSVKLMLSKAQSKKK